MTRRRPAVRDRLIRAAYQRLPYPATRSIEWRLPPVAWLAAHVRPTARRFAPDRVLVAGCGTGREAFSLAKELPDAEIVAIDFSPRTIAAARSYQRHLPFARHVRFHVADLDDERLPQVAGGAFDFISCHGVLSYVERPVSILRHLNRCLAPNGVLFLGVNGEAHQSVRWRQALQAMGLDPNTWPGMAAAQRVLRVLDAMAEQTSLLPLAAKSAAYLSSDIFGPPQHNWPLAKWLAAARRAGLHFRASFNCGRLLAGLGAQGLTSTLMPRSRPEFHALEELLMPSEFHPLLFTREPQAEPPWHTLRSLAEWRIQPLAVFKVAQHRARGGALHLNSRALGVNLHVPVSNWTSAALAPRNPAQPIREILGGVTNPAKLLDVRDKLYEWYLLSVIDLLPPPAVGRG